MKKKHNIFLLGFFMALSLGQQAFGQEGKTCFSLMKMLLSHSSDKHFTKAQISKVIKKAQSLKYSEEEIKALVEALEGVQGEVDLSQIYSYLSYVDSLKDKSRLKAISAINQINTDRPNSSLNKKFQKLQSKVEKKTQREYHKTLRKLKDEYPDASTKELKLKAQKEVDKFRAEYEKLAYGCSSSKMTPQRKNAGKTFGKFLIGITVTSNGISYAQNNWDKEKDWKWFGIFGYETIWGIITSKFRSKIMSNPTTSLSYKALGRYLFSRGTGAADAYLYDSFFGVSDQEAMEEYRQLMQDGQKAARIRELLDYYEKNENRFYIKLKNDLVSNLKNSPNESFALDEYPGVTIEGVDWNHITKEDLEKEEVQEVLVAAILAERYEKENSGHLKTGNMGLDRYIFHAYLGAALLPRDVGKDLIIYNILCHGAHNPKWAMAKAIGFYTIETALMNQFYYWARRQTINQ